MPVSYAKQKKHIYAWREQHKDHYNEIARYHNNRYYAWKRISKIYLNILFSPEE